MGGARNNRASVNALRFAITSRFYCKRMGCRANLRFIDSSGSLLGLATLELHRDAQNRDYVPLPVLERRDMKTECYRALDSLLVPV